jgi:hypothetical protein
MWPKKVSFFIYSMLQNRFLIQGHICEALIKSFYTAYNGAYKSLRNAVLSLYL